MRSGPNFKNRPLKINGFYLFFFRKGPQKQPEFQPVRGFFKKPYDLFQFCIWTGGSAGESTSHLDIHDALARTALLRFFGWSTAGIRMRVFSLARLVAQTQNYNIK